ncbi:MAG: oxygen-independent coproporphyrinogen III oxidase [Bdellovibrionales bacterium]|nr:oxygen-independent coproporphyrinogen III oxidase [Bdellovibrionales bacterium]
MSSELFKKYDVQAPRYTSYPTVPYWSETPSWEQWTQAIKAGLGPTDAGWSIYMHIPFCETLCSFCGCNTVITKSHKKEHPYVERLLKEWQIYKSAVAEFGSRPMRQLHLGGGTPTFLSADNLKALLEPVLSSVSLENGEFEGSIEVDPRRTNREQLQALYDMGFRRVSLGVQDFNVEVQRLINRIQTFEENKSITEMAREIGYTSVNFDLIYGLPQQTPERMQITLEKTLELRPDRVAFYSLAVVPWIKPAQRLFKIEDLPQGEDKYHLYEMGREVFLEAGYEDIGLDHFALSDEKLAVARAQSKLHRNFMGYTEHRTEVLLGLGVSAISEAPTCFHQNKKELPVYEREIDGGSVPTLRGHLLSEEDLAVREQILQFMTRAEVDLESQVDFTVLQERLAPMVADGLVRFEGNRMIQTQKGLPFLRNSAMALDKRLLAKSPDQSMFSKSL